MIGLTLDLHCHVGPGTNEKVVAATEIFPGRPNKTLAASCAPKTMDELDTLEGKALETRCKYPSWTPRKLAPTVSDQMAVGSSPAEGTQSISPLYSGVC